MNIETRLSKGRWLATALLSLSFAFVATPGTASAGTIPPFNIDGTIPDAGCPGSASPDPATNCSQLSDPFDGAKTW